MPMIAEQQRAAASVSTWSPSACRHCGSTRSRVKYTFKGTDKVIRECTVCKLMVLDPMPTEDDLKAVYNEGYFENEELTKQDVSRVYGYVDYISERINKQKGYRAVCETLRQMTAAGERRPTLLDYGCGLGFFLDVAYEFGFDGQGIEFNQYAIDYMRKRYAYQVGGPADLDPRARFDVITLFDVIEHLRKPFETLELVRGMLEKGGIVAISTMDSTSVTSRLMGKRLEDFRRISEHLFFFDRSNLSAILHKHGFDVLKSATMGHSFEMRLLASRVRAVLPIVGIPMQWMLRVLPFLSDKSIYFNPRTKFIVYARKR